jgi:protein-disulfide isomerase
MKNKKILIISTFLIALAAFSGALWLYRGGQTQKIDSLVGENPKNLIPDYAPRIGPENARVFVVEFLDPECESCREFFPITKSILNDFRDQVQLVIRYAPFHDNSELAIRILEASRKQDLYWETLELLFRYQPEWGSHHDPRPDLIWTRLGELKLDLDRLKQDMLDPQITKQLDQDIMDGRKLEVRYTPSFFINGRPLHNLGPRQLREAIEVQLKGP